MTRGTPSFGKRNKGHTHLRCPRCGAGAYHHSRKVCASCGYGNSRRLRKWGQ